MSGVDRPQNKTDEEFPADAPPEKQIEFLLQYGRKSPYCSDVSWTIQSENGSVRISPSVQKRATSDPRSSSRHEYIQLGAVLENCCVAAENVRRSCKLSYRSDDPSAYVDINLIPQNHHPRRNNLFEAVQNQRTSNAYFSNRTISHDVQEEIRRMNCEDEVALELHLDYENKKEIMSLLKTGPATHKQPSVPGVLTWVTNLLSSLFKHDGGDPSAEEHDPPPAVVLLSSWTDGPIAWIKTGQVLQRLSLLLTTNQIGVHPLSIPIDDPDQRADLEPWIADEKMVPQCAFGIGYETD